MLVFPAVMVGLILVGSGLVLRPFFDRSQSERLLDRAAAAWSREQYEQAEDLARRVLATDSDSSRAWLIAGQAAAKRHHHRRALAYFERVPETETPAGFRTLYGQGDRFFRLHQVAEAEDHLRRALRYNSRHVPANEKLSYLLQLQGRVWESLPYVLQLIRAGQFRAEELFMAGSMGQIFIEDSHFVAECRRKHSSDPRILLGQARTAWLRNQAKYAEKLVRRILRKDPDLLSAQALLGRLLIDKGDFQGFLELEADLPPEADQHPAIWFNRGLWAEAHGQKQAAIRCFLETARRFPNHGDAQYRLSQLLAQIGQTEQAEKFSRRSRHLADADVLFSELRTGPDPDKMQELAKILEELGRYWEAIGWCEMMRRSGSHLGWARNTMQRLAPSAHRSSRLTPNRANPAYDLEPETYPLPNWQFPESPQRPAGGEDETCRVRFVNEADRAGLHFTYFNSMDPEIGLEHIFQTTGGGVAVLDYDQNGWPDLYFANGRPLPPSPQRLNRDDTDHRDHLFRNLGNGRFQKVSAIAGLGDGRFGQGVTAGDFNNDGFPDLYVANLGGNRFYRNNGDGTFTEITRRTGTAGNEWTLSCLLADFNGDSLPDLYAANYLVKEKVYDRKCKKNGEPLTCAPTMFPAQQDRVYLNRGDGRFEEVTQQCGIAVPDGKGLGLLAADFDGSGRLSLFVGNDTTPNFFFANNTSRPGGSLQFREQARLTGLAVDGTGSIQACMGIAAGDVNRDQQLDLFVTNFYADANTLYLGQAGTTFHDATRKAGLHDSGFSMLGFGTQFLDGELDGRPDLVIANGHVDQSFATGEPDRMPPQYHRNLGQGRFAEVAASSLGPYFENKHFGRALARLDWNRDGREDFCTVHLKSPAALLTNTTPRPGHHLTVRLRGTESSRDAFGTTVKVTAADRTWTRQLVAGNGYQVRNQLHLVFGLGQTNHIDELMIRWPSGCTQRFRNLGVDRGVLFVEGRNRPLPILVPNSPQSSQ